MAILKASGFVIRAFNYQESGRIVALLSPQLGKISLLAKGARRMDSRFGAALDLLNLIEVVFYEGKGLNLLKDAAIIEHYPKLKRDQERLEAAMQAARSLNLLLREGQGEGQVVALFKEFLGELNEKTGLQLELLKLGFKLKLIDILGFRPELEGCATCRRELERGEQSWFSPQAGGVVCSGCKGPQDRELPPPLLQGWKMIFRLPLGRLERLALPGELVSGGGELLDQFISYHLQPW